MDKNQARRKRLREKIDQSLKDKKIDVAFMNSKSLEEILEEIGIFHQELEFQNLELMRANLELEEMKERLLLSKKYYRDLFHDAPIGYVVYDYEYNIYQSNNTFQHMLGVTQLDLEETPISAWIHPNSQDEFYHYIKKIVDSNESSQETMELQLQGRTKNYFVKIKSNVLREGDKKLIRTIIMDYTDQIVIEKELEKKNNQLQLILENAADGIFGINKAGITVFANQRAADLLGYNRKEIVGKSSHETWHFMQPDGSPYPKSLCPVCVVLETGRKKMQEDYFVKKDGQFINVELTAAPIIEDGQVTGSVVVFRDITERKAIQKRMKENEERLLIATKETGIGIWDYDIVTGNLMWDEQMHKIFGTSKENFNNKFEDWIDRIVPEALPIVMKEFNKALQGGNKFSIEFPIKTEVGELRYLAGAAYIKRNETGEPVRTIGIHYDISERKIAEFELVKAKEQAMAANIAKTEFLASMSHEIRTPMNVIMGMTEVLLETQLEHTQHQYASMINDSSKLLLKIINDILDYSKIEAGKIEIEQVPFMLKTNLEKVIDIHKLNAKNKKVEIVSRIDPNIPDCVVGDPLRLQQILMNLIGNAIKFTEVGTIEVIVERRQGDSIYIAVKDTGIGISDSKKELLFKRFSQVHSNLARAYEGTGLGLAICKQLVILMGGEIGVESKLGEGSTFYCTIPLPAITSQIHMEDTTDSTYNNEIIAGFRQVNGKKHGQDTLHILLVEDKEMNQKLATIILENQGWQVTAVDNGIKAVEARKGNVYDVVLMDISMPEMDGQEATQCIRQWEKEKNIKPVPIIAMTANALEGDRKRYLELGFDDYIAKPIDREFLFKTIQQHTQEQIQVNGKIDRDDQEMVYESDILIKDLEIRLGLDKELIEELLVIFSQEYPHDLEAMRKAIKENDQEALDRLAHGLKGEIGNLGLTVAYEIAKKLEKLVKAAILNQEEALDCLQKLEEELTRLLGKYSC